MMIAWKRTSGLEQLKSGWAQPMNTFGVVQLEKQRVKPKAGTAGKTKTTLSRGRQQVGLLSHQEPVPVCKETAMQSAGRGRGNQHCSIHHAEPLAWKVSLSHSDCQNELIHYPTHLRMYSCPLQNINILLVSFTVMRGSANSDSE